GGAVGGADVVTGLELLQQDHGLTAPSQLPRGGRSHCSSANNYDVHHASSIHLGPLSGSILPPLTQLGSSSCRFEPSKRHLLRPSWVGTWWEGMENWDGGNSFH